MSSIEIARFRLRARTEHELARAAATSVAAAIHAWLAQIYERLADDAEMHAGLPNLQLPFPSVQDLRTDISADELN